MKILNKISDKIVDVLCLFIDLLYELEYILIAYIFPFFNKIYNSKIIKYFRKIFIDIIILTFIIISIIYMRENINEESSGILMFFVVISGLILFIRYFNRIEQNYQPEHGYNFDNLNNYYTNDNQDYYQKRKINSQRIKNGGLTDEEVINRKKQIRKILNEQL